MNELTLYKWGSRHPAPKNCSPQILPQHPNPIKVVCCGAVRHWDKISGAKRSEARCSGAGRRSTNFTLWYGDEPMKINVDL